eukprot:3586546-Alexandrium_andersonii.AAC.1
MSASLVGSEMCIRDSPSPPPSGTPPKKRLWRAPDALFWGVRAGGSPPGSCLLYTSDAADDM